MVSIPIFHFRKSTEVAPRSEKMDTNIFMGNKVQQFDIHQQLKYMVANAIYFIKSKLFMY